jgi:hypothetical protein
MRLEKNWKLKIMIQKKMEGELDRLMMKIFLRQKKMKDWQMGN